MALMGRSRDQGSILFSFDYFQTEDFIGRAGDAKHLGQAGQHGSQSQTFILS